MVCLCLVNGQTSDSIPAPEYLKTPMKRFHSWLLFTVLVAAGGTWPALRSAGATGSAAAEPVWVVTYECLGLYWSGSDNGECLVSYRREGAAGWTSVVGLVYDERDQQYRGSIVGLNADTPYEIQLKTTDKAAKFVARTRSDRFPIGKTTVLAAGDSHEPVQIAESGTPQAYHLVGPPPGAFSSVDVANGAPCNLVIDADYVVVRGVELRNAGQHGLLIKAGHHDVVVENCHITYWGRLGGPVSFGNTTGDMDSAIFAEKGCGRLTFQRNLIEGPRGASNDWESGHPSGPQGISCIDSSGGNVIRYNDIWSTEDHGFNDGIGGGANFSRAGNMNCDSDIYGNFIRNVWDDAIECEGANANVRIWGNYLDRFYNGIATACTSRGPIYIFRNVWARSRRSHLNPLGGCAVKTGERAEFGGGRRFIFHNTALQPWGVFSAFSGHVNPNCVTRNNIFDCPGPLATKIEKLPASDYDYDFFSGSERGTALEKHGVKGRIAYISSHGLEFYPASRVAGVSYGKFPMKVAGEDRTITDPVLTLANPVIDAGLPIPGFNDGFSGRAPDLGAFELGRPPLQFGRRAYLTWDEGWAPWETPHD